MGKQYLIKYTAEVDENTFQFNRVEVILICTNPVILFDGELLTIKAADANLRIKCVQFSIIPR